MKEQDTTSRLESILQTVRSEGEEQAYVEEYTGQRYESFAAYFNEYVGAQERPLAEIIERSNVNRNYAYNIINGHRQPGRDKIIALCLAAGMSCREINRALHIAREGALYAKDERDARMIIAVNRGIASVTELNLLLEREGLPPLE